MKLASTWFSTLSNLLFFTTGDRLLHGSVDRRVFLSFPLFLFFFFYFFSFFTSGDGLLHGSVDRRVDDTGAEASSLNLE